ncbi:MAG TPA: hypothetical protein VMR95_02045 [Candidatus Binatia bacterium]|nr:hypothetical protein [Candidatus Binatia bacterium]
MKQKLTMTIIIAAAISAFLSILIVKFTFGSSKASQRQVDSVPAISSNFPPFSSQVFTQDFTSSSIDTTQLITIGNSTNPVPFNSSTNSQQ